MERIGRFATALTPEAGNLPAGSFTIPRHHSDFRDLEEPFEIRADEITSKVFELRPRKP